ncbi:hypothetical protein OROMI_009003 [Orobanche minor]
MGIVYLLLLIPGFESSSSSSSALPSSTVSVSDSSIAMLSESSSSSGTSLTAGTVSVSESSITMLYNRYQVIFDGVHNVGALINLFIFGFPASASALKVLEPVLSPTEIGSQICQQTGLPHPAHDGPQQFGRCHRKHPTQVCTCWPNVLHGRLNVTDCAEIKMPLIRSRIKLKVCYLKRKAGTSFLRLRAQISKFSNVPFLASKFSDDLNAFKAGISPSSRIIVDELLDRYSLSASGQNYSMKASIPCLLVYQYIAKTPPQGDPN